MSCQMKVLWRTVWMWIVSAFFKGNLLHPFKSGPNMYLTSSFLFPLWSNYKAGLLLLM